MFPLNVIMEKMKNWIKFVIFIPVISVASIIIYSCIGYMLLKPLNASIAFIPLQAGALLFVHSLVFFIIVDHIKPRQANKVEVQQEEVTPKEKIEVKEETSLRQIHRRDHFNYQPSENEEEENKDPFDELEDYYEGKKEFNELSDDAQTTYFEEVIEDDA